MATAHRDRRRKPSRKAVISRAIVSAVGLRNDHCSPITVTIANPGPRPFKFLQRILKLQHSNRAAASHKIHRLFCSQISMI
jgi:hypothetical protein